MVDPGDIRETLQTLANIIRKNDPNASIRLLMLAEAINGGIYANAWARSDLFKMIDPDTLTEQLNGTRKDVQKFRSDLVHALAGASLILYQSQSPNISPSSNLDDFAIQLHTMSTENAKQLGNMAQNISSTFEKIAQEMTEQIQKSNRYFEQLGNFVSGLIQLSTEMQEATSTLQKGNQELATSMNRTAAVLTQLLSHQQDLFMETQASTAALRSIVSNFEKLVEAQTRIGQDLSAALGGVNGSLQKTDQLLVGFKDFTVQQGSILRELEEERKAQGELAKLVSKTADTVGHALTDLSRSVDVLGNVPDSMKNSAAELHSIVENMRELLRIQSTLPESMNETIQSYSSTAEAIERSSQALDESVMALHRVSQEFIGQTPRLAIERFEDSIMQMNAALQTFAAMSDKIARQALMGFEDSTKKMNAVLQNFTQRSDQIGHLLMNIVTKLEVNSKIPNEP